MPGALHPFLAQAVLRVLESFGLDEGDGEEAPEAATTASPVPQRRAAERACVAPGAYAAAAEVGEGEGDEGEGGAELVECPPR